jgi:hypothetical protein
MTDTPEDPRPKLLRPNFDVAKDEAPSNKVERTTSGDFMATWRGKAVYQNGRIKKFPTEAEARSFLARCNAAGKIIHERT